MSIQYTVQGFKPTTSWHESPPKTTRPWLHPEFSIFSLKSLLNEDDENDDTK